MAVIYCDYSTGSDASSGLTIWANAKLTLLAAMIAAGAGGIVYVRTDGGGTKDTVNGNRTLTFPGTVLNPILVYGCKSSTTAEPPTDSDIAVRGTDALPTWEAAVGNNDINLGSGFAAVVGMGFISADRVTGNSSAVFHLMFKGCEWEWSGLWFLQTDGQVITGVDVDFKMSSGSAFLPRAGNKFFFRGGLISGTAPNFLVDTSPHGTLDWIGGDLSILSGKTLLDSGGSRITNIRMSNCEMPASYSLLSGTSVDHDTHVEVVSSSNVSALGSTDTVQQHDYEDRMGSFAIELTAVRTGGAEDPNSLFAYAITPKANATLAPYFGIKGPMRPIWIAGDGTAKKIEIFIANSSASTDYNEGEVTVRFFTPSSGGTAQHDINDDDNFVEIVPGSPAALTDDTGSTWGTGANNHQKLVLDLSAANSPDFEGPLFYQLQVNKRQGTPDTLYLDPKPVVT